MAQLYKALDTETESWILGPYRILVEFCCFSKPKTAFTQVLMTIILNFLIKCLLNASNGVLGAGKDLKWFKQNLLIT